MALFPCTVDGARYRGPQQTMYPALVRGSDSRRGRLRLCPRHFEELRDQCRKHLEEVIYDEPEDRQEQLVVCSFCGGDGLDASLMFVTVYAAHSEEAQFYGRVCGRCDAQTSARFGIH